jgi:creatinine amidohydrolase
MENFPWTRLPGVDLPSGSKPRLDQDAFAQSDPGTKRRLLGDGNYWGLYERSDTDMLALWEVAVDETRAVIDGPWTG